MTAATDRPAPPATFAFTPENVERTAAIIAKYPPGRQASAVIPLLDLAQRQSGGWLPGAAIEYVAGLLDMPVMRVFEVATFYTMFNLAPVGRFHVEICTNLPCWLRGSDDIVGACRKALGIGLGETTADGLFTVSEVECQGACVNAPMAKIGDDFYEDLTPDAMETVLQRLRAGEQPKPGSQLGRTSCEPLGGVTSLKSVDAVAAITIKDSGGPS
ncbi:MAG: NADH-quinone oxidoreductase subunit NuoE [Rhodospirillales bacterium]